MIDKKDTILILGEGPTEFYYFNSLKELVKNITIRPDYPKHTNLTELDKKIKEGVDSGYSYVYCIIDMDTKSTDAEKLKYLKLKQKYSKHITIAKKGIDCSVVFFETHPCTEIFFLYYFLYTSKNFVNQGNLIQELKKRCDYNKSNDFFKKTKGLHQYFEKKGGLLSLAIKNANKSIREKTIDGRSNTYSELGNLMKVLLK